MPRKGREVTLLGAWRGRRGFSAGAAAFSAALSGRLAPVPSARKVWFPAPVPPLPAQCTGEVSQGSRLAHFPLWQPLNLRTSYFPVIKRSETPMK